MGQSSDDARRLSFYLSTQLASRVANDDVDHDQSSVFLKHPVSRFCSSTSNIDCIRPGGTGILKKPPKSDVSNHIVTKMTTSLIRALLEPSRIELPMASKRLDLGSGKKEVKRSHTLTKKEKARAATIKSKFGKVKLGIEVNSPSTLTQKSEYVTEQCSPVENIRKTKIWSRLCNGEKCPGVTVVSRPVESNSLLSKSVKGKGNPATQNTLKQKATKSTDHSFAEILYDTFHRESAEVATFHSLPKDKDFLTSLTLSALNTWAERKAQEEGADEYDTFTEEFASFTIRNAFRKSLKLPDDPEITAYFKSQKKLRAQKKHSKYLGDENLYDRIEKSLEEAYKEAIKPSRRQFYAHDMKDVSDNKENVLNPSVLTYFNGIDLDQSNESLPRGSVSTQPALLKGHYFEEPSEDIQLYSVHVPPDTASPDKNVKNGAGVRFVDLLHNAVPSWCNAQVKSSDIVNKTEFSPPNDTKNPAISGYVPIFSQRLKNGKEKLQKY